MPCMYVNFKVKNRERKQQKKKRRMKFDMKKTIIVNSYTLLNIKIYM